MTIWIATVLIIGIAGLTRAGRFFKYELVHGPDVASDRPPLGSYRTHRLACAAACLAQPLCGGFNHVSATARCHILNGVSGPADMVGQQGTVYFGIPAAVLSSGTTNTALEPGVTCLSSTDFSATFTCVEAIDGSELAGGGNAWASGTIGNNVGDWIQISFPEVWLVTGVDLYHRCGGGDACSGFDLDFSDGSTQQISRVCNDGLGTSWSDCTYSPGESYSLAWVYTTSLKITCTADCDAAAGIHGFREVKIWTYNE